MHLAIDAIGTYGRGGAAILEGLLAALQRGGSTSTFRRVRNCGVWMPPPRWLD